LAAGGLGLGRIPAAAQSGQPQPPPITTDEPDDCAPVPPPPAQAIPFVPDPTLPLRQRRSAFSLDQPSIDKLKAAFQALRALPNTDPRSWIRQANVHCWYCGGGLNSNAGEEIHGGWWFFPWHRCYLYFFERILGSLVGDNTLALPYWDWDNVEHVTLPPPYTTPNDATNPLCDLMRGVDPSAQLSPDYVGPQIIGPIMQQPSWDLFMGTDPESPNGSGGSIENGPHGVVHLWTGKPSMYLPWGAPDMGVLATAAQDPIFFAHHANIDRLWDVWANSSTTTDPLPPSESWLSHSWTFYDENQQWRSIKVGDVIKPANLNYTYGTVAASPPALAMASFALPEQSDLHTDPKTAKLQLPDDLRRAMASSGPSRRRYILHLEGVEVPESQAAHVRVFLNKPDADVKTSTKDPSFVGYFVIVPMSRRRQKAQGHAMARPHLHNYQFDVTAKIPSLRGKASDWTVTLVPIGVDESKPLAMNVTYKKLYVRVKD
jgi:polyphenol oxidase